MEEQILVSHQKRAEVKVKDQEECEENHKEPENAVGIAGSRPKLKEVWPQIAVSCAALSTAVQSGVGLAYSATLIPQLEADPSISNISTQEASWIASISAISTPAGAITCGQLVEAWGRKYTLILSSLFVVISWIITYVTSTELWPLYVARFFIGFASGLTTAGIIYVSEVSCREFRGALLCLNSVAVSGGILLSTAQGTVPWRWGAIILATSAIFSLIICLPIPETPSWLLSHGFIIKARHALFWLNRASWLAEKEWSRLRNENQNRSNDGEQSETREKWKKASRQLLILVGIFVLQQLSGVYVVIFYAGSLCKMIAGDLRDEFKFVLIGGIIRFLSSIVTAIVSIKIGRRVLMVLSSFGVFVTSLSVALFMHYSNVSYSSLINNKLTPSPFTDFILISLLLMIFSASFGLLVLPWTLMGELLPPQVKGPASGALVSFGYFLMFAMVKAFPHAIEHIPISSAFVMFSITALLTIPYVLLWVPETLNKSYAEIELSFKS